jgi:hypothetical protein
MNAQEERDFLALKMLQEFEDKIVDLQLKYDELELAARKERIELKRSRHGLNEVNWIRMRPRSCMRWIQIEKLTCMRWQNRSPYKKKSAKRSRPRSKRNVIKMYDLLYAAHSFLRQSVINAELTIAEFQVSYNQLRNM